MNLGSGCCRRPAGEPRRSKEDLDYRACVLRTIEPAHPVVSAARGTPHIRTTAPKRSVKQASSPVTHLWLLDFRRYVWVISQGAYAPFADEAVEVAPTHADSDSGVGGGALVEREPASRRLR